jgi:hypothetical protein
MGANAWKALVAWREESAYTCDSHQWLERSVATDDLGIEFVLDLHLPIVELQRAGCGSHTHGEQFSRVRGARGRIASLQADLRGFPQPRRSSRT